MSLPKIRKIALSALFYLTSCSHVNSPQSPRQEYFDMDMQPIFDYAKDAQIVSFGEYHALDKRLYPYITHQLESERFYRNILPGMANLGYLDIVIEGLFSDIPQRDLDYFMESGQAKRGSLLEFNLHEFPDPNVMQFFRACRHHGINMHPGGISSVDYLTRRQLELISSNEDNAEMAAALYELNITEIETITENMKNEIEILASDGNRVISFSGIRHNNCNPDREAIYDEVFEALTDERRKISVSFGSELYERYSKRYLEVDLIAPETLDTIEVNGRIERIVNEMVPYEYIILSIVSRGHGLIRYNGETENRLLTIFNLSRNRTH